MEERAKGNTTVAIRKLMGLQPKVARVLRGGKEQDIPLEQLKIDDLVSVRPVSGFRWMAAWLRVTLTWMRA